MFIRLAPDTDSRVEGDNTRLINVDQVESFQPSDAKPGYTLIFFANGRRLQVLESMSEIVQLLINRGQLS